MPAYTISQLEDILGKYAESNSLSFREMMAQALPRIYRMGVWPELCYETSFSGEHGYITLPVDTAGVLACTVNDRPHPARSLWHDVRISGRSASLSSYYGIVDDSYHPVMLDMKDVQGVATEDDVVAPASLHLRTSTTTSGTPFADFTGEIRISFIDEDGSPLLMSAYEGVDTTVYYESPGEGVTRITSITYNDILTPFDIVDPNFPTKTIATIPTGSGVLRFRRFRTPEKSASCVVHLLLKRDAPSHIADDTVIHLGNIGAIKNAMMAIIEEDSGNLQKSQPWWAEVEKILDEELQAKMGAAKPTLRMDFGPCPPIQNIM